MLEKIKAEIEDKLERAKESYEENSKISINAYGTGYELGVLESMKELLEFISELESENKTQSNFYERMIIEQKDLMQKLTGLKIFKESEKFKELDAMSQLLLESQFNIMSAYLGVLSSRFFIIEDDSLKLHIKGEQTK